MMTARQYERALEILGLTHEQAAQLLDVTKRASHHWASKNRKIPGPAEAYLRHLIATGTTGAKALEIQQADKYKQAHRGED